MTKAMKRSELLPLVAFCGSDATITVQSYDRKNKFTMPLPAGRVRLKDYVDMVEPSERVLFEGNLRLTAPRRGVVQQTFNKGHYNTAAEPFVKRSSTDQQLEVLSSQVKALAGVVTSERVKARKTAAERDALIEKEAEERKAIEEAAVKEEREKREADAARRAEEEADADAAARAK